MPKKGGDVLSFDSTKRRPKGEAREMPPHNEGGEGVVSLAETLAYDIKKGDESQRDTRKPGDTLPVFGMNKDDLRTSREKMIALFQIGSSELPRAEVEVRYDTRTVLYFAKHALSDEDRKIVTRAEAGDTTAFEEAGRILQEAYRKFYIAYVDVYVSARKPENMRFPFRERPQSPVPPEVAEEEGVGGLGERGYRRNADDALREKKKPKVKSFWDWLWGKE